MSILKTKGETDGIFKWTDNNSAEAEGISLAETFQALKRGLSGSTNEKIGFTEVVERLKTSLADIAKSENKDFLRMEVVRNKHGDVVRLRVYMISLGSGVDENLFFSDREALLSQGADISNLYNIIKDSGVSVIEKSL